MLTMCRLVELIQISGIETECDLMNKPRTWRGLI